MREWCDPEVLRLLRRRSLARLRREIEPVEARALGRFLPAWQGVGSSAAGTDRLVEVIAQLEGLAIPASVLERDVLPARIRGYQPRMLDELLASGEVVWVGAGSLGRDDGRLVLWRADRVALAGVPGAPAGPSMDGPRRNRRRRLRTTRAQRWAGLATGRHRRTARGEGSELLSRDPRGRVACGVGGRRPPPVAA